MAEKSTVALSYFERVEKRLRALAVGAADEALPDPVTMTVDAVADLAEVESRFQASEEIAAVSGRFEPASILDGELSEATRQGVLSRLAAACVVESHEERVKWLLVKERREAALARLVESDRLQETLARPLPVTDAFGDMLRELLRDGAHVRVEDRPRDELIALAAAIEATSGLDLPRPDLATVRRVMGPGELLADYEVLLAKGFVGREPELARLRDFVPGALRELIEARAAR